MLLPRLPDGRLAFERQQDRPMATSQGDVSSLEASNPSNNPCRVGVSTVYFTSKLIYKKGLLQQKQEDSTKFDTCKQMTSSQ